MSHISMMNVLLNGKDWWISNLRQIYQREKMDMEKMMSLGVLSDKIINVQVTIYLCNETSFTLLEIMKMISVGLRIMKIC